MLKKRCRIPSINSRVLWGEGGVETNRSKSNRFSELARAMYADVGERTYIDRPASGRMGGWMDDGGWKNRWVHCLDRKLMY